MSLAKMQLRGCRYNQWCDHHFVKRCTSRHWRRLAKRLLDDAPTKRPIHGYSD